MKRGCPLCGEEPTYLTPHGLRCREHIHGDDEWDDWIPLVRGDSRRRTARPMEARPDRE